jgi:predicted metal-dependent peptidase
MKFQESEEVPSMGVNLKGDLKWNRKWCEKLTEEEMMGVIAHEILHCLTPNEPVLTDKGIKPIKDIKEGDRVWSHSGSFTKVVKTEKFNFKGKTYKIRARFGLPVEFTGEHPILAIQQKHYNKNKGALKSKKMNYAGFKYVKAEDLKENDLVCIRPPKNYYTRKSPKHLFRTRDKYAHKSVKLDKDTAYFLGFFIGDGSLHSVKKQGEWFDIKEGKIERQISLTLSMKDDYERLMKIIKTKFFRSPCLMKLKDKNARRILFSGKSVAKFLRRECYDGKEKTIPSWFVNCDKSIIKAFVDGLRDADGHITKTGRTEITNTAKGVYSMLPLLLMKLGLVPAFSHYKRDGFKTPYRSSYNEHPKKDTAIFHKDKFIMPIQKIEVKDYEGDVYNIETKAHTFCVPYFTTHNCALLHLERGKNKNQQVFNVANDIIVNDILKKENFRLPTEGCITEYNDTFELFGYTIRNVSEKSSEEIYDEIYHLYPKIEQVMIVMSGGSSSGKGEDSLSPHQLKNAIKKLGGFDVHIYGDGEEEAEQDESEKEQNKNGKGLKMPQNLRDKWKKVVANAASLAKQQGKLPAGIERMIDNILDSKVNWQHKLYKYVVDQIICDFSWNLPSKRSAACGVYLPRPIKESVKIVASIDTSGSIGKDELEQFMGELLSIGQSFPNINIDLIVVDAAVHETYELTKENIDDLLTMKMSGGGGTSHLPVYKYVIDNIMDAKVLINFTDGFTDFPNNPEEIPFDTLWVIDRHGCDPKHIPFGEVIKID